MPSMRLPTARRMRFARSCPTRYSTIRAGERWLAYWLGWPDVSLLSVCRRRCPRTFHRLAPPRSLLSRSWEVSSAVEQIALALADEEVDVQISAAVALGRLEEDREGASAHLRLALQSPHAPVRAAAARALGKLGAEDAVPALRGLVRDEAAQVALAAVEGLRRIRDSDAADAFVESLGHGDAEVVKEGLRAICASGGARAVDRVAVGLAHAAWDVRQVAANLLGELGPESVKHLEGRLEVENDSLVRTALTQAIERVGKRSES